MEKALEDAETYIKRWLEPENGRHQVQLAVKDEKHPDAYSLEITKTRKQDGTENTDKHWITFYNQPDQDLEQYAEKLEQQYQVEVTNINPLES
ncbi:MAG: hypothetical protein ABEJ83_03875 [Candidatus Nanohaloarchaea archaeon]